MNNLPKDPIMLLSVINMKLRDYYKTLDELCEDLSIDRTELEAELSKVGFEYNSQQNQFR